MADELVLSEPRDGVLVLTFNRPDRLNAWTEELGRRYYDLLEEAEADPDVRVVVVTGAGRGFCAGADFERLQGLAGGERGGGDRPRDTRTNIFPTTLSKPIIAAINGPCAGLGMVLALMCDIRFAAEQAKFTTAFAHRGLIAEYGISWVLPKLVGLGNAMDLLLSSRTFTGDEAARLGLVNRALPGERLMDEVLAYARGLAERSSPASMAAIKRQLWGDWDTNLKSSEAEAMRLMVKSFERPDFAEGVKSFLEKRLPDFPGLPTP
ncbi:MAG: enoyl-CoA hydratase [Streptosporangiales bacterium]|nr:enoyl-CoA hydratase [Streptosporangiales bacterium]